MCVCARVCVRTPPGRFWTAEQNFECAGIKGLLNQTDPSPCNTGDSSISDRVCAPQSTVVGYMGGTGEYPNYGNYTQNNNYSETSE